MADPSLHERNRYSDPSFPYAMFSVTPAGCVPRGRGFNELHWHEELQFTLVTAGKIMMQVNGTDIQLLSGQAIFINKGVLHMAVNQSRHSEYVSFNFPEKLLAFFEDSSVEKSYVSPYTNSLLMSLVFKQNVEWQREILRLLWEIKTSFEDNKAWGWSYEVALRTVRLWYLMISNISLSSEETSSATKQQQERMQLMISYIHRNYAEGITLREIADAAHLSVSECSRSFKKTLRTTPYDYLIKYRIKKSAEWLVETDDSISEISDKAGFNHVNHFIQSFKKHRGQTPKAFRQSRLS